MPVTAALDAKAGSNSMMDRIAEEFSGRRRLRVGLGFALPDSNLNLGPTAAKSDAGADRSCLDNTKTEPTRMS